MFEVEDALNKFETSILKSLEKENMKKNLIFLKEQQVGYIEDILNEYIDLFLIDYKDFIKRIEKLNQKYEGQFWLKAKENASLLEELLYEI